MEFSLVILILIVVLALVFEFTNGFHDMANSISTVIGTKVLKPLTAIALASVFNFLGATQVSKVAETITSGFISIEMNSELILLSTLIGAIFWNILTWYFKIPSSSTYALIGGLVGSGIISVGHQNIFWNNILLKVILPMTISPLLGFIISFYLMKLLDTLILKMKISKTHNIFGKLQIISSSFVSLSHGFNDAQKTMALISLTLYLQKIIPTPAIPVWVIGTCAITMAIGSCFGGLRIVETVSKKISTMNTSQGFIAESTASSLIISASLLGFPLSSTHLIVGSVGGVGAAHDKLKISKSLIQKLSMTWFFTLPGSALVSGFIYMTLKSFT